MKTINLKEAQVTEVIFRPEDGIVTITYNILDDAGAYVSSKTISMNSISYGVISILETLMEKLLNAVEIEEGLKKNDMIK